MTNNRANGFVPQDYHMHSNVSCDCQATMAEMAESALAKGIHEIAFTEHYNPNPADICSGYYQPESYFARLEEVRAQYASRGLTIRAGIELGEYHTWRDEMQPVLDAYPYDFVLGSLHWVGMHDSIFHARYFENHAPDEAIPAYFTELEAMVRGGGFDVVAHADVFKRVAYDVYGAYNSTDWEDLIRSVWQACIDCGIGIEINTAGLRKPVNQTHPALDELCWYREMGGDILTIGSDGHQPSDVGAGLDTAVALARQAGFTHLASFERRRVARWLEI